MSNTKGPIELVCESFGDDHPHPESANLVSHEYLDGHVVTPAVPHPGAKSYLVLAGRVFPYDPDETRLDQVYDGARSCPEL